LGLIGELTYEKGKKGKETEREKKKREKKKEEF
jgi:hypothetical protein